MKWLLLIASTVFILGAFVCSVSGHVTDEIMCVMAAILMAIYMKD